MEHGFKEGWKLEAVNPNSHGNIHPATVSKVIDENYFIVEIDEVTKATESTDRIRTCCHGGSPGLFPVQWCMYKGLKLAPPKGRSQQSVGSEDS